MNKLTTKQLCEMAILMALYCILSSMMKFPIIGAISLDLGYIALTIGCIKYHEWGALIGSVGCGLESILFSPYGFSISWFIANLIIGYGCGYVFKKTKIIWQRVVAILIFVALGILITKTAIECYLYSIPLQIKIVKNLVAFIIDAATMIVGLILSRYIIK